MAPGLMFYLSRLRRASGREWAHRLVRLFQGRGQALAVRLGWIPCRGVSVAHASALVLRLPEIRGEVGPEAVEWILQGNRYTLNLDPAAIRGLEERWRGIFAGSLGHQGAGVDLRGVWEPARLQHLMVLIRYLQQETLAEGGDAVRAFARQSLISWLEANPLPFGPHHMSAMECALRLPVFLYALQFLAPWTPRQEEALLRAVYAHGWWIRGHLSLHSSSGNHTLCEAAGLVFAGAANGGVDAGRRWLERGIALYVAELLRQVLPDGGPLEQSFTYHRFNLDLGWLLADFLEGNQLRKCADLRARLALGEIFLAAVGGAGHPCPMVGDGDGGFALGPGLAPVREVPVQVPARITTFPEAGYTVLLGPEGSRILFDHGPLGMAPLYNHGHADALAVALWQGGREFLVDPGTYRYNVEPEIRRYFKGTRAHSTVTVDGRNQAEMVTETIWAAPYRAWIKRMEIWPDAVLIQACHDGYTRLTNRVTHFRTLVLGEEGCLLIHDTFTGDSVANLELNFQLHPEVVPLRSESGWSLSRDQRAPIQLSLSGGSDLELVQGQADPGAGWFSSGYGCKQPAQILRKSVSGLPGRMEFLTILELQGRANRARVEALKSRL